jgi:ribosomal protein S9
MLFFFLEGLRKHTGCPEKKTLSMKNAYLPLIIKTSSNENVTIELQVEGGGHCSPARTMTHASTKTSTQGSTSSPQTTTQPLV